jgi:predicted Zn-dependent peptidase
MSNNTTPDPITARKGKNQKHHRKIVLVGDFKTSEALAKIRNSFESIPRQPDPPAVDMAEPQQKEERRATVDDVLARAPRVDLAYKAVAGNTADFYALQVLGAVLQSGQSSRLYQTMVKEKEMVTSVGGFMDEKRGVGAFYTNATLRPGVKTEDVEETIYAEIDRLKKEPIADWELQKAKNTTRRSLINSLQSALARAVTIGQYATYYNEPGLINARLERVAAVTKEDVQRVANKYLASTNRTVVITMPKAKANSATGASGQ